MPRAWGFQKTASGEVALEKTGQLLCPCMSGQEGAPEHHLVALFSFRRVNVLWVVAIRGRGEERRG